MKNTGAHVWDNFVALSTSRRVNKLAFKKISQMFRFDLLENSWTNPYSETPGDLAGLATGRVAPNDVTRDLLDAQQIDENSSLNASKLTLISLMTDYLSSSQKHLVILSTKLNLFTNTKILF